jgi:hypothetical protein
MVATQLVCTAVLAMTEQTKALIVTIRQERLSTHGSAEQVLKFLPMMINRVKVEELGALGEVVAIFKSKIANQNRLTEKFVVDAWDNSRAEWVEEKFKDEYTLYIVVGDLVEDDGHMAQIWQNALSRHSVVDFVSMTHEGRHFIRDAYKVPQDSNKIRMVHNEACNSLSGLEHFIEIYGAKASSGHGDPKRKGASSSPVSTFAFLDQWKKRVPYVAALDYAWTEGKRLIGTDAVPGPAFLLVQLLTGANSQSEALWPSAIQYALTTSHPITIDSQMNELHHKNISTGAFNN